MIHAMAKSNRDVKGYFAESRDLFTSVVLVIPLFLVYQVGILATGGLRNGVDFVSNVLFLVFDGNMLAYAGFNLVVLAAFVVTVLGLRSRGQFQIRRVPWMLLEALVYSLLLGFVVNLMIDAVGLGGLLAAIKHAPATLTDKLVMSAGAGLYEEIVFRGFLMGGMLFALTRLLDVPNWIATVIAILVSSVLFSAAHHLSEPFTMSAFIFRIGAGIVFAVVYRTRGLAVAAYTHCFYDVWVMVFRGG
jgi:membrane protease YdiL (CAAX protease family)